MSGNNSSLIVFSLKRSVCRGRVWSHRALGRDETHVASVVLRRLGVKANAGENITMVTNESERGALLSNEVARVGD